MVFMNTTKEKKIYISQYARQPVFTGRDGYSAKLVDVQTNGKSLKIYPSHVPDQLSKQRQELRKIIWNKDSNIIYILRNHL